MRQFGAWGTDGLIIMVVSVSIFLQNVILTNMYSAVTYISNADFGAKGGGKNIGIILSQTALNRSRHVNQFDQAFDYEKYSIPEISNEPKTCSCLVHGPKKILYDKVFESDIRYSELRKIRRQELQDFYRFAVF